MTTPKFSFFEVDGAKYRSARINAVDQLGLVMKLGAMLPVIGQVRDYARMNPGVTFKEMDAGLLGLIGGAFEKLSDDARVYVLGRMLGVVERDETGQGNWFPVWDPHGARLMDPGMNLYVMMQLLIHVFTANLASFTTALGLSSSASRTA